MKPRSTWTGFLKLSLVTIPVRVYTAVSDPEKLTFNQPHKLPVGPALKAMAGSMVFCLEGYEADRRELYTIPEVRRFYGALHRAWPYGLYFCDLNQDDLRIMALCCLRSVSLIQVDGRANGAVAYDRQELDQLLQGDLPLLKDLCKWAELSAQATARRSEAVLACFQLRFRHRAGVSGRPLTPP